MHLGITDYLEIMQLAGVSELRMPAKMNGMVAPAVVGTVKPTDAPAVPPPAPQQEPSSPPKPVAVVPDPPPIMPTVPLSHNRTKDERLRLIFEDVKQCTRCKDLASSRTQPVFGVGNPDAELLFLGEAPGAEEDKQGEPFVGRAGQLLTDIITKGMRLRREDVFICNILCCRPPGNRNPLPDEAAHCQPFLEQTLEIVKPKFVCCLGAIAAKNLLNSNLAIGALRGKVFDYNGIKVICTYHPAYLLRNPAAKKSTWEDIQLLMREMERTS